MLLAESAASYPQPLDPHILADVLEQVGQSGEERWGLRPKSSFLRNLLFSVADNGTLKVKHHTAQEKGQHLARIPRQALTQGTSELFSTEAAQSPVTEIPSDVPEASETPTDSENESESSVPMHEAESSTPPPPVRPERPSPRYGHAACRCEEFFSLFVNLFPVTLVFKGHSVRTTKIRVSVCKGVEMGWHCMVAS